MSKGKEYKELLLKDLCARLPYNVMCQTDEHKKIHKLKGINKHKGIWWYEFDGFRNIKPPKPYLRSMSLMTKEEQQEYYNLCHKECDDIWAKCLFDKMVDFCLKNHLDYRGLIERGLAIEAPEGMYNINYEQL